MEFDIVRCNNVDYVYIDSNIILSTETTNIHEYLELHKEWHNVIKMTSDPVIQKIFKLISLYYTGGDSKDVFIYDKDIRVSGEKSDTILSFELFFETPSSARFRQCDLYGECCPKAYDITRFRNSIFSDQQFKLTLFSLNTLNYAQYIGNYFEVIDRTQRYKTNLMMIEVDRLT